MMMKTMMIMMTKTMMKRTMMMKMMKMLIKCDDYDEYKHVMMMMIVY